MGTQTAVLVSSSALAMAMFASPAQAQTPWSPAGDRPIAAGVEADRSKREASSTRPARINELVYANVEGGYETLAISTVTAAGTLSARDIRPVSVETSGGGAFYGVGAGFRFAFFTLGGRVRGAHLSAGDLSTIDGELGARLVFNRFEPYFTFGAGYAKLSASSGEVAGIPDLDIHGYNARAGLGLDYYPDKNFTLGVNVGSDVLAMARSGVDLSTSPEAQARERVKACQALTEPTQQQQCATSVVHDVEGASAGVAGTFAVMMGVHF
jgi:hypothetical protein